MYVNLGVNDSFYGNIFVMLGVLSGRLDLGLVMLWGCYWNFIVRKFVSGNKNLIYSSGSLYMN